MYFANYVRKSPCLNCNQRNLGCHKNCILFFEYKNKIIKNNSKELQEENLEQVYKKIVLKQHRNFY